MKNVVKGRIFGFLRDILKFFHYDYKLFISIESKIITEMFYATSFRALQKFLTNNFDGIHGFYTPSLNKQEHILKQRCRGPTRVIPSGCFWKPPSGNLFIAFLRKILVVVFEKILKIF